MRKSSRGAHDTPALQERPRNPEPARAPEASGTDAERAHNGKPPRGAARRGQAKDQNRGFQANKAVFTSCPLAERGETLLNQLR